MFVLWEIEGDDEGDDFFIDLNILHAITIILFGSCQRWLYHTAPYDLLLR